MNVKKTILDVNNIVRTWRVQPTVAVDVAITYTPTRTVQVSNNIVRTWRAQPTVAVDVAMTYTPTRRTPTG